jgi:signal transduction histidine kinase
MDRLSQITLLYVEDDELIREELAETLEFDVKELYIAENGIEGLKKFRQFMPDIVISDVKMPKMNGLDMAREIRKISPNTPIIITTAFSDSEYLMKAIEIGINRYVTKPIDIDKLYSAIDELATILLHKREKQKQEEYLRYILDFNPSFILIANKKKIEYINQTFLNFLGFNSFEHFTNEVEKVDYLIENIKDIDGNIYPKKDWIERVICNYEIQHIIYFKHSIKKPFIVLQNSFSDLNRNILLFSDITSLELNRLSLNNEILKLKTDNQKKLELLKIQSKQALMGEMIGAIAHQWKQPLSILSISMQSAQETYEKDEIDNCVDIGLKQVEYMSKTVDDFRNFLSPSKEMKKFFLAHSIDNILSLFAKQLEVHNISLDIDIDHHITLFGYQNEFEQAIMNLIKNSKDAFENKKIKSKTISIKSKIDQKNIHIEIEDNAGGIEDIVMQRIFDPYFTTKTNGTGIGLYISKMLINDMQGDISVQSKDQHTKFTITVLKG